jgi:hypothetical protein
MGPLDTVNPLDYSELTNFTDPLGMKIARPMVHLTYRLGDFTKLEGAFIPWFRGHQLDLGTNSAIGRWTPSQLRIFDSALRQLLALMGSYGVIDLFNWVSISDTISDRTNILPLLYVDRIDKFEYAQGGLRFTTTLGSADLGIQYYSGCFFRPALSGMVQIEHDGTNFVSPPSAALSLEYNRYHQLGIDYAQVLFGLNIRAETGVNLTSDFSGDDIAVENPALVWALGFDRDLFWGINLNLQGTGTIRLMHDRILQNPEFDFSLPMTLDVQLDCETGKDMTSTRITALVTKKFLQDELEVKCSAIWGIEDKDFLIIPALIWTRGDISLEGAVGIFGGDSAGELGQYADNTFVKAVVTWKF